MKADTQVAYSNLRKSIIDIMAPADGGELRSYYAQQTLDEMRERYPDIELTTIDNACDQIEAHHREPVSEIDQKKYIYFLEVLPPENYTYSKAGESFKMCEHTSGNITAIFARLGDRYFRMQDTFTLSHDEIMRRVREFVRT